MAQTFEDSLETVLAWLEAPPPSGSPEEARFLAAVERVLAEPDGSEAHAEQTAAIDDIVRVDDDLRRRLNALANARRNPFGDHPDGIGPTLGMDLKTPKQD
ncbi:hypothetical protein CFHF_21705 [Caulobacter flavus]|uniref:Uncharacterized protein n=1 Tax=Caulobacter flavus TaxID=1679497 RepID=A0A2N5CN23_9CAUL|nr:hypothetical protein [Caulobacter flavus]AYV46609.1 hypothetical protein C1707_10230 [Caulobacter flavus]PLR07845.1 hypothetical protein CFHF_21705 [Caulobacter flavus]